jgi:ATP-dependent Lon protease
VGGIKEKVLAAHRGQVRTVIIPRTNRGDLQDIPKQLRIEMEVILVDKVTDVLRHALVWN